MLLERIIFSQTLVTRALILPRCFYFVFYQWISDDNCLKDTNFTVLLIAIYFYLKNY